MPRTETNACTYCSWDTSISSRALHAEQLSPPPQHHGAAAVVPSSLVLRSGSSWTTRRVFHCQTRSALGPEVRGRASCLGPRARPFRWPPASLVLRGKHARGLTMRPSNTQRVGAVASRVETERGGCDIKKDENMSLSLALLRPLLGYWGRIWAPR